MHPFRYDGIGEIAYRQAEGRIEFIEDKARRFYKNDDWPYADYPKTFSKIEAAVEVAEPQAGRLVPNFDDDPAGHAQHQADGAYSENFYPLDGGSSIILGANQSTSQQHHVQCPVCSKRARLIARVPSQAQGAFEKTWPEDDIFVVFWFCDPCAVVITQNECS